MIRISSSGCDVTRHMDRLKWVTFYYHQNLNVLCGLNVFHEAQRLFYCL